MSPMEQLAKQEYERGYSDGKSDFFAAGVAEGEMRARQRMIANRVAANQHPFAASGKPIDHIADAGKPLAEPMKQEPVAIYMGHRLTPEGTKEFWGYADNALPEKTKLYTAPVSAKREWVDLTDDEIDSVLRSYTKTDRYKDDLRSYRAVIAAFKEKNQ